MADKRNSLDFQTRVKEHLGEYKQKTLGISEKGIFLYHGEEHPYDHILPKEKEEFNILEKYRAEFFTSEYRQGIKLHQYFHHLNSSQAMCINFFYPLIKERELEALVDLLGINGSIKYDPEWVCFEKASDLEKAKRRTNFDFYIKLDNGTKIYFEIKYTENEFGKPKYDQEHIEKFKNIYEPLLRNNSAIKGSYKCEDKFLDHYQVMRNLVHIDLNSYVVFIYPSDNKGIREGTLAAQNDILENGWKDHLILLSWEDLIEQLINRLSSKVLFDYYDKNFSQKYLNIQS